MPHAEHNRKQKNRRGSTLTKRARTWIVLAVGLALACFVVLPLLYNGTLFDAPVHEEVYAASNPKTTPAANTPATNAFVEASPTLTPQMTAFIIAYPPLSPGDDNEAVSVLQQKLMDLGYMDDDVPSTEYNDAVTRAVELFQRVQGMDQTGIATSETLALLYSGNAAPYTIRLEDRGSDVRSLQRRLNVLGYFDEKDNGYFGTATQAAVLQFQKKNNLPETGDVDYALHNLLYSPDAKPLIDPTPTPKATKTPKPSSTPKATAKPTPKATAAPTYDIPIETWPEIEDTPAPTATPKATKTPSADVSYGKGVSAMIAAAQAQIGKPYVWGDEGPDSYDCSGLVYYCLRQAGVSVSRYTALSFSQVDSWKAITRLSDCKPGDLLFYKSDTKDYVNHAGIYIGNNQFIHASSSKGKVILDTCTSYYERNFIVARRVF